MLDEARLMDEHTIFIRNEDWEFHKSIWNNLDHSQIPDMKHYWMLLIKSVREQKEILEPIQSKSRFKPFDVKERFMRFLSSCQATESQANSLIYNLKSFFSSCRATDSQAKEVLRLLKENKGRPDNIFALLLGGLEIEGLLKSLNDISLALGYMKEKADKADSESDVVEIDSETGTVKQLNYK